MTDERGGIDKIEGEKTEKKGEADRYEGEELIGINSRKDRYRYKR